MPRRASSSANPIWIVLVVVFIVASLAGGYYLYNVARDPYRTLTTLDTHDYLTNANSLRGNTYKVRGTVFESSLDWSATKGRIIEVDVDNGGSSNSEDRLPLLVPPKFNDINIQKGQKFYFQVEVGDKGILTVSGITKA
ncbi:MAG TPA: hypothetical protein VG733_06205 [Chthoniobacteraceae bacterium]|nr:hypothetical protein [Chthoniobacteraceae bacterium]